MSKDKNAVALGKKSYEARKHKHDSEYYRELGKKSGEARKMKKIVEGENLTRTISTGSNV